MTAGHYQDYDLFADKETREQAEIQRRDLADHVQDYLTQKGKDRPPVMTVTQLVRSYTIAFDLPDGGNGMVLIWSARNLALTFQTPTGDLSSPATCVFHTLDDLLKSLDKIFPADNE